ncbi:MAG: hypothetical protein Q4B78_04355 [Bacillota bacterium]|nr:hypothetical protein [Bacillota bacterium]
MNSKNSNAVAIIAYITWIGFIVALFIREEGDDFTRLHLNQALVLNLLSTFAGILTIIPLLGSLVYSLVAIVTFVFWVIGLYRAITWNDKPLPFVGEIQIIK